MESVLWDINIQSRGVVVASGSSPGGSTPAQADRFGDLRHAQLGGGTSRRTRPIVIGKVSG
jgi:hypothetical protein